MRQKYALTLEDARRVAAAARAHAEANQWPVVIAIVDDGGHLIYLERLDNTQAGSCDVAIEKARTAIRFRRPSQAIEAAIAGGRTVMLKLTGATPIEGGIPLVYQGDFVGAIGISGVTSEQDGQIAKAGATSLGA